MIQMGNLKKRTHFSATKKSIVFIFTLFVAVTLHLSAIAAIFPGQAQAQTRGLENQNDRTILYALMSCVKRIRIESSIAKENLNSANTMAPIITGFDAPTAGSDSGDPNVPVGYEIDSTDGNAMCENISLTRAMRFIDKTPKWFFTQFYDVNDSVTVPLPGEDAGFYGIKDQAGIDAGEENIRSLMRRKGADPDRFRGSAGMGQKEVERRLAIGFYQCFEPIGEGDTAASDTSVTLDDKKYQLRASRNGDTKISVGKDWVADGKITCNTFKNWDKDELKQALSNEENVRKAEAAARESGASAGGGDPQDSANCQSKGWNPVAWILCPIYDGMAAVSDWLMENMLAPLLRTKPINTTPGNGIYEIWSSFRIYANIFLVIAMLIMVFGQAIGGGMVEAYTAKKALPRILAAAILVNLSIYIVAFAVDVTNVVGKGVHELMTAPLGEKGLFNVQIGAGTTATAGVVTGLAGATFWGASAIGTGAAGAAAGAAAFAGTVGAWAAVLFMIPAILGLLMAFVTILLRQAIILALVITAPVAFVLWCLPNTEKYFKMWWDLLLKMLIAYPIIMIIFAICDILAVTARAGG